MSGGWGWGGVCNKHPWWEHELVIKRFQDTVWSIPPSPCSPGLGSFPRWNLSQGNNWEGPKIKCINVGKKEHFPVSLEKFRPRHCRHKYYKVFSRLPSRVLKVFWIVFIPVDSDPNSPFSFTALLGCNLYAKALYIFNVYNLMRWDICTQNWSQVSQCQWKSSDWVPQGHAVTERQMWLISEYMSLIETW